MLIKSEFKVDLFHMKHTKDPDGLLQAIKDANAAGLGRKIIEAFPYKKDEERSFSGELPEMSLNRDHEFVDVYESRFYVLTEEEWKEIQQKLSDHNLTAP